MTVVNDTGSTLSHLECTWCGQTYDADQLYNTCPACGKVLYARYNLAEAARTLTKEALVGREPTMWRYREILPVKSQANIVSLARVLRRCYPRRVWPKRWALKSCGSRTRARTRRGVSRHAGWRLPFPGPKS